MSWLTSLGSSSHSLCIIQSRFLHTITPMGFAPYNTVSLLNTTMFPPQPPSSSFLIVLLSLFFHFFYSIPPFNLCCPFRVVCWDSPLNIGIYIYRNFSVLFFVFTCFILPTFFLLLSLLDLFISGLPSCRATLCGTSTCMCLFKSLHKTWHLRFEVLLADGIDETAINVSVDAND